MATLVAYPGQDVSPSYQGAGAGEVLELWPKANSIVGFSGLDCFPVTNSPLAATAHMIAPYGFPSLAGQAEELLALLS